MQAHPSSSGAPSTHSWLLACSERRQTPQPPPPHPTAQAASRDYGDCRTSPPDLAARLARSAKLGVDERVACATFGPILLRFAGGGEGGQGGAVLQQQRRERCLWQEGEALTEGNRKLPSCAGTPPPPEGLAGK